MSGIRFVDPPGRGPRRRSLGPGLLTLAGTVIAVLFLMVVLGLLEQGLGIALGDILASPPVAN